MLSYNDGRHYRYSRQSEVAVYGEATTEYRSEGSEANRIIRITGSGSYGIKQTLEESVAHPERLLVSFRVRAVQKAEAAISFGYTNREKLDAEDTISLSICPILLSWTW